MERNCQEHPYAINWGPVRPQTPRMQGLHPDHLTAPSKANTRPRKTQQAPQAGQTATLVPALEAGWELVFRDDFTRDHLGEHWTVVDGEWTIEDECLRGSGMLISAHGFPGDGLPAFQRLEFEATADVQTKALLEGHAQPKARVSDLSAFIHARALDDTGKQPFETGYFFQFGGFWNTKNQLRRAGVSVALDPQPRKLITPSKAHRVVVQNDNGHLSFFVDRRLILEHAEDTSLLGPDHSRVGFYFYTAAKVRRVRVYVKRLANDLDLD
jgi:hypothetical protein